MGGHCILKIFCFNVSTKLQEGGPVSKYLLHLKDLNDQFFAIKKPMDEEDMVALLMRSFPLSFNSFVESLHLLGENQQLTFEKLLTLFCTKGKEARSDRSIKSIHYNECIKCRVQRQRQKKMLAMYQREQIQMLLLQ